MLPIIFPPLSAKKYFLFFIVFFHFSYGQTQTSNVSYIESIEDFVNPDRGFYHPINDTISLFKGLDYNTLVSLRTNYFTPFEGNYSVRTSLILRHYILDTLINSPLPQIFLNNLQADFDVARQAGVRLILRFSYTNTPDDSCGQTACPPYGDANKSRVLEHISQLDPYFKANEDVISVVQKGFIGIWGEQYYTDHFGDASYSGDSTILDERWQDRIDVLNALLLAVPSNRMVQVRYPQMKQKYIHGISAPVSSPPMNVSQAYTSSDTARIGLHNDCFLSAPDDFGTYWDYGSSSTYPSNQTSTLKPYAAAEGMFTVVGGETCSDTLYPQNNCDSLAVTDMNFLHYSFLNSDYNNQVNNDWQDEGCMDDIKNRLGYRFVMLNGIYPNSGIIGTPVNFTLNFENKGFAAPFNERKLQIVLRNMTNASEYKVDITGTNTDSRFWQTGNFTINGNFDLPSNLPNGDYELLLYLFDSSNNNAVANRPEYCIRLANTNTWESTTGYNNLNHIIHISTESCINIDGNFDDWGNINSISSGGSGGFTCLKAADDNDFLFIHSAGNIDVNYQIFIDSDNNALGNNEYMGSNWANTGFNFLIENGSLYSYSGTGIDWSWNFIEVLNAVKNNLGLELKISKSQLIGMSSSIQIAAVSLNSNWMEVGYIPLSNTASNYLNTSVLDCGCTNENLSLSGNISSSQNYETNGTIESTEHISGNVFVEYDSQISILLDAGFEISNGVDFYAFIDGCNQTETFSADENTAIIPFKNPKQLKTNNNPTFSSFHNPSDTQIKLKYEVVKEGIVSLSFSHALSNKSIHLISNQYHEIGSYLISIDTDKLPKGIYFVSLKIREQNFTKQMVIE